MNRVLLLIDDDVQRGVLRASLADDYDLLEPASDGAERSVRTADFELAIVDAPAVRRLTPAIAAAKQAAHPLPLPVLLVAGRADKPALAEHLGRTVDEVIHTPLDKLELHARIEMILSTRRLAVALHARTDDTSRDDAPVRWALDLGRVGVWEWDVASGQGTWSANVAPVVGVRPGMVGPTLDSELPRVHPEDRPVVRAAIARAVRDGSACEFEVRASWPDASLHWVAVKGQPLRDGSGNVSRVVGVAVDVTERRRRDEELAARVARQAALAELGQQALSGGDVATLMDVTVRLAARTLGVEYARIMQVLPDRRSLRVQAGFGWRDGVVGHIAIGATVDAPAGYALAHGAPVVIEDLASETRFAAPALLREHGVVSGISVVVPGPERPFGELGVYSRSRRAFTPEDVGFLQTVANMVAQAVYRRDAEERLALLLENVPAVLWTMDTDLRVTSCAGAGLAQLGVTPSSLIGRRVSEVFGSADPELPPVAAQRRAAAGDAVDFQHEWNGRTLHAHVQPLRARTGDVVGVIGIAVDMTEWATARAALQANEERFRALVEHSYEAMTLLDPTGRVLYVSPSNARVFGRGPDSAIGIHWKDNFHPDFVEKSLREFGELLQMPGGSMRGEGLIRREDGEWRWMDVIATNMLDNPHVRAICVNSRDVTDRRRAEEALRWSEERLQLAASGSNTGLWDWDIANGRLYYSPQWKRQLGYEDDEIGDSLAEWVSRLHPDDHDRMVAHVASHVRGGSSTYEAEQRLRHKDGTYRWILSRGSVLRSPDGTAYRMLGVNVDIDERKAAEERVRMNEERLRLALSIARMGTWEWDLVHNQLSWSGAVAEMFGYGPKSTVGTYEGVMSRVHRDDRHLLNAAVVAMTERHEDVDVEFRALWPDGTQRWLASRARTFTDERGVPVRVVGVNCDITERKQAEIDLRESQRRLRGLSARLQRALEDERTRIAREIHDGFGQALTALKIDLSWLRSRLDRSRPASHRELSARTKAMTTLVDETIQAVRQTATELRPVVLDDLGLLAAIEWQAREFEERTGIRCELGPPGGIECADRDVATAVFRIVQEALTNVARHAGATRVRIALREHGGALALEVADDGRGITETERSAPSSLGLVGMRERARLLGGALRVIGVAGRGTKVIARIPLPAAASRQRRAEGSRCPA